MYVMYVCYVCMYTYVCMNVYILYITSRAHEVKAPRHTWHASHVSYEEEEDTCMSYEKEDTCMSYEKEDTCMSYERSPPAYLACAPLTKYPVLWTV